jgi:hypothetical protein
VDSFYSARPAAFPSLTCSVDQAGVLVNFEGGHWDYSHADGTICGVDGPVLDDAAYSDAFRLVGLAQGFVEAANPQVDWEAFYA